MESTKEGLYEIIKEQMRMDDLILDESLLLIENLGFDSVQLISLIIDIETRFGIEFNEASLLFEKFNRIGDLIKLIDELRDKVKQDEDI